MRSMESRLRRLEEQLVLRPGETSFVRVRFGHLQRLPKDYLGERHVEVVRQLPDRNGQEWVEFAELPGPKPAEAIPQGGILRHLDVAFISPDVEDQEDPPNSSGGE